MKKGPKGPLGRPASEIHIQTARENGKKGGRPPAGLPKEMLAALGDAPIGNPIKLARWYTSALALLTQLRLRGAQGVDRLAEQVRANATAAGKVLPHDIIFTAARVVQDDDDELAADGGPVEVTRTTHKRATRALP